MSSGNVDLNRITIFPELTPFKEDITSNLNNEIELVRKEHFNMAKKIHFLLKNSQDLTLHQKYDYCERQRSFMKLYLNEISRRFLLIKGSSEG